MKKFLFYSVILLVIFLLITKGDASIEYAREALILCYSIIIPSLFPFFICSNMLVASGFAITLSKIFQGIMVPLFNINPNGSSAFVLGLISGYPTGALTACQLYEGGYLSKSETERLLSFCNNTGPLFILSAVGVGLFFDIKIGIMLYITHVVSAILVGITMRFYKKNRHTAPKAEVSVNNKSYGEIFTESIASSINSTLTICGTIIFFSVVSRLLINQFPIRIPTIIYGIFEISGGLMLLSQEQIPLITKIVEASFVVGFAGLCVHTQVLSIVASHNLSMVPYILGKLLHGIYAAVIAYLFLAFSPAVTTFSKARSLTMSAGFLNSSIYLSIAAIVIILLFLMSRKKLLQ